MAAGKENSIQAVAIITMNNVRISQSPHVISITQTLYFGHNVGIIIVSMMEQQFKKTFQLYMI
jgi:hypothetical protein